MAILSTILLVTAAVSGIVTILAKEMERDSLHSVAKPLTTFLIFLAAFLELRSAAHPGTYFFILALAFCIAGDILLLSPKRFLGGLVAFLVGHVCIITALVWITSAVNLVAVSMYVVVGGALFAYLWPNLGAMRFPVLVYVVVILLMGWRTSEVLLYAWPRIAAAQLFVASTLFILSDWFLAIGKFRKPVWRNDVIVLATYYSSLILFTIGFAGFR